MNCAKPEIDAGEYFCCIEKIIPRNVDGVLPDAFCNLAALFGFIFRAQNNKSGRNVLGNLLCELNKIFGWPTPMWIGRARLKGNVDSIVLEPQGRFGIEISVKFISESRQRFGAGKQRPNVDNIGECQLSITDTCGKIEEPFTFECHTAVRKELAPTKLLAFDMAC